MRNVNGLVARFNRPLRDFKGQKLCESCWNGNHYITDPVINKKLQNCIGEPCECKCRDLLAEKHPRIKKDFSSQVNIAEVVGDDVIQIGNPQNPTVSHRDDA